MSKTSCLLCGRLTERLFCDNCSEEGRDRIDSIQAFLKKYPGIATIEVCRELGVSLSFIKGLVSAGYLNMDVPKSQEPTEPTINKSSGFHIGKNR